MNYMKGGSYNEKVDEYRKEATTTLAALALVIATTSVPSACYHWFAQPVEPEELRKLVNDK